MAWENIIAYIGISVVFGIIKAKLKGVARGIMGWIFSVSVSICVGVIVGFALEAFNLHPGIVFAIVSAAAITAESIVISIIDIGQMFEKDPVAAFKRLRDINQKEIR